MKKKLFFLCLVIVAFISCESVSEEASTVYSTVEETILETKEIHPSNSSSTSKMNAYVYLASNAENGGDRIIFNHELRFGRKLVLRMQSDGNLCLNVVAAGTETLNQPTETLFVWGAFNYPHTIGAYQLINDSNGNVAIFKDNINGQCIWTTNTIVSPEFDHQYLIVEVYERNSFLGATNKRTYARMKLVRQYFGGEYQGVKTICDEKIDY